MSPTVPPAKPALRNRTWTEEAAARAARAFAAGSLYFLAIGFASWAFGSAPDRLVHQASWAMVLKAAALLLALALIAAGAMRLFRVRDRAGDRLLVGSSAVTLLVAAELVGGPMVRPWGLYETLTRFLPEPSSLFLALLMGAVFVPAIEPIGLGRRRTGVS